MPGLNPPKKLHLAKNIEELQKQAKVPNTDPSKLVRVAQKLLTNAKENELSGDQEKAYILFYKYFEVSKIIRKSLEYKKDKMYYDGMMNSKELKEVIEHLEALTISLKDRYDEKDAYEAQKVVVKDIKNNLRTDSPTPKQIMNNGKVLNEGVLLLSKYDLKDNILHMASVDA